VRRLAVVLAAFAFGCATLPGPADPVETEYRAAVALLKKDRFADAIQGFQAIAERHPKHPRAQDALYSAGYARLHPRNPGADPEAALRDFQRLVRAYPDGPRRDEAQSWIALLTQLGKLRSDLQRLLDLDVESEKKRREIR
jgi:TolA-binding protein